MSIEAEAIQVAAVAAALVEDCQRGPAAGPRGSVDGRVRRKWWEPIEMVLGLIRDEHLRQAEKWGRQPHAPVEWLMILAVEAGELAEAVQASAPVGAPGEAVIEDLRRAATRARQWLHESEAGPTPPM